MPSSKPPVAPPGDPRIVSLAAGTVLSRVHSKSFTAVQFNPTLADPHWGGGRFDATQSDPYGFLYAGSDDDCAVCEVLLRDVPLDASGGRILPRATVKDRVLSRVTVSADVPLVSLCDGQDLARLGQGDNWLISCPSAEYGATRRWAHAIRSWAPDAQGFIWPSRRDLSKRAVILFEDRFSAVVEEVVRGGSLTPSGLRLDSEEGERYLRTILERYWMTLAP